MEKRKISKAERRRRRRRRLIVKSVILILLSVLLLAGIILVGKSLKEKFERKPDIVEEDLHKDSEYDSELPEEEPTPEPTPEPTLEPAKKIFSDGLYSKHAVLIRLKDEDIMMDKAGEDRTYPASITKVMTAIVALEQLPDLEEKITLSSAMFDRLYEEGASMAGFEANQSVSVRDLLYGVMLPSGAEACIGLAERIAGSEEGFVELMNKKAEALGMNGTHFVTSTGLHDAEHYTTARDMSHLLAYALKNPEFRTIFTATSYTTAPTSSKPEGLTFQSTMFKRLETPVLANGGVIEGGKTGYTSDAGLCLASLAKIADEEYILVTTGAEGDHTTEQFNLLDALDVYNRI